MLEESNSAEIIRQVLNTEKMKNFISGLFTFEELFEQIKTIHNMFGFNTKYLRYYSRKLQENVNSFNNLLQKLKSDFEISFENLSKEDASLPLQS